MASASAARCGRLPKTVRRVASQLSVASVQLHDLDPQPVIDALDEAGVDVASLGVTGRINEIRAAADRSLAGFDELLNWLDRGRPSLTPAVVCHGDIHPFNMLMTADDSFNVLDWTNANLCRREFDVGFTAALLQCAPIAVPPSPGNPLGALTGALARRFIDTYRRMAPINLDVVEWFEVLQYGRCLAAVATTSTDDAIIGASHPFRVSAPAMIRQVEIITGVTDCVAARLGCADALRRWAATSDTNWRPPSSTPVMFATPWIKPS